MDHRANRCRYLRALPAPGTAAGKGTGAKTMAQDSWTQITLANADGLCPEAEAAVQKVVKTRSNIQNN